MILCADAGNSYLKLALVDSRSVRRVMNIEVDRILRSPNVIRRRLHASQAMLTGATGAIFCSVVPAINRGLAGQLREVTGHRPLVVDHSLRLPFELRVKRPHAVGPDRICAAVGAVGSRRRARVIVVDIGSAITVDLVIDGGFRGGVIMAGPGLVLKAMGEYASRLPRIDLSVTGPSIETRYDDTRSSMLLGAHLSAAGGIREAVRVLEVAVAPKRPRKVLTGGGAGRLHPRLPRSWTLDGDLVLKGLYRIWGLNA
jgi:type III pantothenate kinase